MRWNGWDVTHDEHRLYFREGKRKTWVGLDTHEPISGLALSETDEAPPRELLTVSKGRDEHIFYAVCDELLSGERLEEPYMLYRVRRG